MTEDERIEGAKEIISNAVMEACDKYEIYVGDLITLLHNLADKLTKGIEDKIKRAM